MYFSSPRAYCISHIIALHLISLTMLGKERPKEILIRSKEFSTCPSYFLFFLNPNILFRILFSNILYSLKYEALTESKCNLATDSAILELRNDEKIFRVE